MSRKYSKGIVGHYQRQADKRAADEKAKKEADRKAKERKYKAGLRNRHAAALKDAFGIPAGKRLIDYDSFVKDKAQVENKINTNANAINQNILGFQERLQMLLGKQETDKDRATLISEMETRIAQIKHLAKDTDDSLTKHMQQHTDFMPVDEVEKFRTTLKQQNDMYADACTKILNEELTPQEMAARLARNNPVAPQVQSKPRH